jgi:DNA repair photolyase
MLNKLKHVDSWFWAEYTLNPYRGCAHACVYCDARANQYGLSATFDQVIYVKVNAVQALEKQLPKLKRGIVATGGVCDAYQPAEAKFHITQKVLETLLRFGFGALVMTKSDMVLRDLDLLQRVNEAAWAGVIFTITTFDPEVVRLFEPGAPSPERRLEALEKVAKAGLVTGVIACPLLPGICDDEAHIEEVVRRAKGAGAQFVLHGGLTLKKGPQRERYMEALVLHYPHLVTWYEELYGKGYGADPEYARRVSQMARAICRKHGVPDRMKRPIIRGEEFPTNKRIAALLAEKVYEMEITGENESRVWAYRRASWAVEELEEDIKLIYERMGRKGLEGIKWVGESLAKVIEVALFDKCSHIC